MNPWFQIIIGVMLVGASAFGGIFIRDGLENLKKQSSISQLDKDSLDILDAMDGLIFDVSGPGASSAMRHLMNLGLIKLDIFPSQPISFQYYPSDQGMLLLTNKLRKELYPKILRDLFITRYWQGYPKEFSQKKEEFLKKYRILWDECWESLAKQIKKEDPEVKGDALASFNSYKNKNSFDTIMKKIVNPWLKQIGR